MIAGVALAGTASEFWAELLGWRTGDEVITGADGVAVAARAAGPPGWTVVVDGDAGRVVAAGGRVTDGSVITDPCGVTCALGPAAVALPEPGPGRPAWFEHMSTDPESADAFLAGAFGWSATPAGPGYALLGAGGPPFAGRLALDGGLAAAIGPRWMVYLAHPDVDGAVGDVERLGGTVAVPPRDTPTGRLTAVVDPAGALTTLLTR
jgi:uncharacterized protein